MNFFSNIPAGGTIFNALAVLFGGLMGLSVGKIIPERLQQTIFNCLGLLTLYIGMNMAFQTKHSIAIVLSLVIGTVIGDLCGLDEKLNNLGETLKAKTHSSNSKFTEGFVSATLLFCVGAMAIVGSFEDGLRHNPSILITKGVMDGISSILFASSFGAGVLFSSLSLFIYQGILTLLALWVEPFITPDIYADISGLGGLMIIGIALNLLKITKLKLCDMLPSLIFIVPFSILFALF